MDVPAPPDPKAIESRPAVWLGRLGWLAVIVSVAIVLATAVRLFGFAGPVADDMVRAGSAARRGVWPVLANSYRHWSGRWSGIGTSLVLSRAFDFHDHYSLLLLATQAVVPLSLFALLSVAAGGYIAWPARALLCLGLVALHWDNQQSLGESYNWLTGAVENHLSLGLAILVFAGLIRTIRRGLRGWGTAVLATIAAVITGMHELYGLYLLGVLLAGTVVTYRIGGPSARAWAAVAAATAVGLAVVLSAPGNARRLAAEQPIHDIPALGRHAAYWGGLALTWLFDVKLLLATLTVVCHPRAAAACPEWLRGHRTACAGAGLGMIVGLLVSIVLINWWTLPARLPYRTHSAVYLLFLLGWFFTATAVAARPGLRVTRPAWAVCAICFAAALLDGDSLRLVRSELADGRLARFHAAVEDRDRLIRAAAAAGDRNPAVPPIGRLPSCLMYAEIVDGPNGGPEWHNRAYCLFYGLESIRLRHDAPPGDLAAVDHRSRGADQ